MLIKMHSYMTRGKVYVVNVRRNGESGRMAPVPVLQIQFPVKYLEKVLKKSVF